MRKSLINPRDMKFSSVCLWNFPEDRSPRMSSCSSVISCVGHFGPFQSVTPAYFALSLTNLNHFWLIMKSCSSLHDHIKWIIASWYFYLDIFQTQISFPALTLIFSDTCKYCIVSTSSQWREAGGLGPAPTKRRKQMWVIIRVLVIRIWSSKYETRWDHRTEPQRRQGGLWRPPRLTEEVTGTRYTNQTPAGDHLL